ncbi:MAG TPA: zinc-ribbon domain-containing protein, partial [Vicinamibacterales bacterium]|nr:zinc-ribbon domain-containing protein [Vicinamibacterales bacterium]
LGVLARKTSTKAPSWLAWIPIANLYLMSRIARRSLLMAALMLVPLVNLYAAGKLWQGIAIARGKPGWTGWLILVPGLNLLLPMYLASGAVTDSEAEALAAQAADAGERPAFCPECGAALEPDQQFCGECGFDVTTIEAPPATTPEPAAAPAAATPKEVMRSPGQIAAILAGIAVVALAAYVIYDSFGGTTRTNQIPPMPPAMAGTLTEFPIDSAELHPLQPDAIVTQTLGTTPPRVPASWLPRGVQAATISRHAEALTSATYRAHPPEAPVAVTVLKTTANPLAAAQEISREVAQAASAAAAPIQVKTPTGEIFQGTRIRNDKEATYVLAQPDNASVVIVHAADPAAFPAAERLAANVGNGAGLAAFPSVLATLGALPSRLPQDWVLHEARTVTAAEIGRADAQLSEAAKSTDGEAQQLAAQARMVLPEQLMLARYQDPARRDWSIVRGQYGSSPRGLAAWTVLRSLMTFVTNEALPLASGEGRLLKLSDRQIALIRSGASLVMLAAPAGATADNVRQLAQGIQ